MARKHSLVWRLTLLFSVVSATIIVGLSALVIRATQHHFLELDHAALLDKSQLIAEILQHTGDESDAQHRLGDALRGSPELRVQVQNADGWVLFQSPTFPELIPLGLTRSSAPDLQLQSWRDAQRRYVSINTHTHVSFAHGEDWKIFAALDTVHHDMFIVNLQQRLALYSVAAILLATALGWWAARRGLWPLRAMQEKAKQVSGHRLHERMPIDAVPLEMAHLAQALNQMLDRIDDDFQRLTAFSSDLAHELRTPINNVLTQTQVALATRRDVATYRDILGATVEELQRLARTVSDMLYLAKTERDTGLHQREWFDASAEITPLFEFYGVLSDDRNIRLEQIGQAQVWADRLMFRRALSNLLTNAIRHAQAASVVQVVVDADALGVDVSVCNHGTPIPVEVLPKLFERFYRADPARTHPDAEGAGLGLAITRAIARAHGGDAWAQSDQGRSCFSLHFPTPLDAPAPPTLT